MLVVDSSVWIDFFNGRVGPGVTVLKRLLRDGDVRLVMPDLVLHEVLRGFRGEYEHRQARLLLESLDVESAAGHGLAVRAAEHYRALRQQGWTTRSPFDALIATFCIENDYLLLHQDRDFEPWARSRGLRAWEH